MAGSRLPAWLVAVLGCSIAVALATGNAAGSRSTTAGRGETPTVTVGLLALEPAALALYAHDRGFFEEQGLDVTIQVFSAPSLVGPALLSGQVQFAGITAGAAAQLKAARAPVKLVAAAALDRQGVVTSGLVAGPGETIRRPSDLIGKRIALDSQYSLAHLALLKWLARGGVAADRVQLRWMAFPLMLAPLRRGTIEAAVLPEPFLTLATRRGARLVAHTIRAVCPDDCLLTGYASRTNADPGVTARFRNAIQAAATWANSRSNDRASAAILARYTSIDPATIARMARSRFATRFRPAQAQPWIDALAEFGAIPAPFPAVDLVR
jgi:NitT/TauT family transport system substrate-binding protein